MWVKAEGWEEARKNIKCASYILVIFTKYNRRDVICCCAIAAGPSVLAVWAGVCAHENVPGCMEQTVFVCKVLL